MKAEIISIGTELLLGEIVNTDASFIAAELPALGIDLYHIVTVGDNKQRIVEALAQAQQRTDIIITTGGLGPTQDDITRESVAEFLHEEITIDSELVRQFEAFFARRHIVMSPSNKKQASVIPSAEIIPNKKGTAPGWWVSTKGKLIITLPGPNNELKDMWDSAVKPRLKRLGVDSVIVSRTIKIFGLPESTVDDMISHLLGSTNPTIGVYAKPDGIHLRLTAKEKSEWTAAPLLQKMELEIRGLLEEHIWGGDSETIEQVIRKLLCEKGLTVATMEADTGGMLTAALTGDGLSQEFFKGGYIASTDKMKVSLGISAKILKQYGKISAEIVTAMATRARELAGANIGLAVITDWEQKDTGRMGTGHGYLGIDDGRQTYSFKYTYPGQPLQVKQRSVTGALLELRKILRNGGKHASHN